MSYMRDAPMRFLKSKTDPDSSELAGKSYQCSSYGGYSNEGPDKQFRLDEICNEKVRYFKNSHLRYPGYIRKRSFLKCKTWAHQIPSKWQLWQWIHGLVQWCICMTFYQIRVQCYALYLPVARKNKNREPEIQICSSKIANSATLNEGESYKSQS